MKLHEIIERVIDKVDLANHEGGCLTLAQEHQLVKAIAAKDDALTRIARRWPCETAQAMADEAQRAL